MDEKLSEHLLQRPNAVRMPRKSSLYEFRLSIDYSCMLFAREYVYTKGGGGSQWFTHFRVDSSPQFARNYLVGELDVLTLGRISVETDEGIDSLPRAREEDFSDFSSSSLSVYLLESINDQ